MSATLAPDLDEAERVVLWREHMLLELEFTPEQAALLVAVRDLDWHRAEHMRELGMSHELIVDQLT